MLFMLRTYDPGATRNRPGSSRSRGSSHARVESEGDGLAGVAEEFQPIAQRFDMRWRLDRGERVPRIAVLVSRYGGVRLMDIDAILQELTRIRDRLSEELEGDEYAELVARRDELRRQAREAFPATEEGLRAELERLVEAWDRLQKQRIDVVEQAGDLAAGNFGFTSDAVRLNRAIDEAAGRAELERRIRELKARLEE